MRYFKEDIVIESDNVATCVILSALTAKVVIVITGFESSDHEFCLVISHCERFQRDEAKREYNKGTRKLR